MRCSAVMITKALSSPKLVSTNSQGLHQFPFRLSRRLENCNIPRSSTEARSVRHLLERWAVSRVPSSLMNACGRSHEKRKEADIRGRLGVGSSLGWVPVVVRERPILGQTIPAPRVASWRAKIPTTTLTTAWDITAISKPRR